MSLAWLAKNDFDNSGTIILKERIEDCEDCVAQINKLCGANVAIPYYASLFIRNGRYIHKEETSYRRKLIKYPILVMTHQGFIRKYQRLRDYICWTSDKSASDMSLASKANNRTRLIIDEHPTTLNLYQITNYSLYLMESFVQSMGNKEMFESIFKICSHIRKKCFVKPVSLENQYWDRCRVKLTDKLDEFFYENRNSDELLDIYTALKIFCKDGGFVNYSDDEKYKNITVGKYIDIFDKIFNTVIMDGTAKINNLYEDKRFNVIKLPTVKTYSNTQIRICKQLNGSRTELTNNDSIIDSALEYIKNHKPADENGLIITLKKFEHQFIEKGLPSNTMVDHFGNITGTNKYRDFKYLYMIGVPYMSDNAYKLAYHIYRGDNNTDKSQGTVTINGVRKPVDYDYRRTANSMIASELVQAVNRVRCRKWQNGDTLETYIFMFGKDWEIIDLMKECMQGVNIIYDSEFYENLPQKVQSKKPILAIDAVLSTINKHNRLFPSGQATKNEIFGKSGFTDKLSDKTRAQIWKHPSIKQLVADRKIRINTKYIEFLS